MAPQLNAAQHILIKTLLNEGFGTKLIATEAVILTIKEIDVLADNNIPISYDLGSS